MYVKKLTTFCQILKTMHTKENWFLFLPQGVLLLTYLLTTLCVNAIIERQLLSLGAAQQRAACVRVCERPTRGCSNAEKSL